MAFYHDYLINKNCVQKNINKISLREKYNLKGFNVKQIVSFFENYDEIEKIHHEQRNYQGNSTLNPEKIYKNIKKYEKKYNSDAGQLYLSSLPMIQDHMFADKNILYFLKSDYLNIIKFRKIDLFVQEKSYLIKAALDNDIKKIDYLINSGITTEEKLDILSQVGETINIETLNKLLQHDLINLNNKNHYPNLNKMINLKFPLKEMISKGFQINNLNLQFCYENSNLEKEEYIKKEVEKIYIELMKNGITLDKILKESNLSLFYISSVEFFNKTKNLGLDINYKIGSKNLLTSILMESVFSESDKNKKSEICDFLLKNGAILKSRDNKDIKNDKIISLEKINKEIYPLLLKYDLLDFKELTITVQAANNNPVFVNKLISKGFIGFKNIIIDEYQNLNSINSNTLSLLIKNTKDLNDKMQNGNSLIEQSIIDGVCHLLKEKDFKDVFLSGNDKFKEMFAPEEGKITQFNNIYDEEMYDFLRNKNLLKSAYQYSLEDLNKIIYPMGLKLFEHGYIRDDIINPIINDLIDPFYASVKIYAIDNGNINKIKDNSGNDLLLKTYNKKLAGKLIKHGMEIIHPLDKYHPQIKEVLFNFLKSRAENEKEVLIGNIEKQESVPNQKPRKRL